MSTQQEENSQDCTMATEPTSQEVVWISAKLTDTMVDVIKALHKEHPRWVFHLSYPRYNRKDELLNELTKELKIPVMTFNCPAYNHAHIVLARKLLSHPKIVDTMSAMGISPPMAVMDQMVLDQALGCHGVTQKLQNFVDNISWSLYGSDGNRPTPSGAPSYENIRNFVLKLHLLYSGVRELPKSCEGDYDKINEQQLSILGCTQEPSAFRAGLSSENVLELFEHPNHRGEITAEWLARNSFLQGDKEAIEQLLSVMVNGFRAPSKDAIIAAFGRKAKIEIVRDFLADKFPYDGSDENKRIRQLRLNLVGFLRLMDKLLKNPPTSLAELNQRQAEWVRDMSLDAKAQEEDIEHVLVPDFLDRLDYSKVLSIFGDVDFPVSRLRELGFLGGDVKEIEGTLGWISKCFTFFKDIGSLADHCNYVESATSNSPEYKDKTWEQRIETFIQNDCVPPPGAPKYVAIISDMEKDDDFAKAVQEAAYPGGMPQLILQCPKYCGNEVDFYHDLSECVSPNSRKRKGGKRAFFSSVKSVADPKSDNRDKIKGKGHGVA